MTRGWFSLALSCCCGAITGAFLSIQIASWFAYGYQFWFVGALVGGIVSYATVDFKNFCAGVAHAYRRTVAWRPNKLYWQAFAATWLSLMAFSSTAFIYYAVLAALSDHTLKENDWKLVALYVTACIVVSTWVAIVDCSRGRLSDDDWQHSLEESRKYGWEKVRQLNIIGATWIALTWVIEYTKKIPDATRKCIQIAIFASAKLREFVAAAFIIVHSQRRTICFVDATLGAAVGYYFGNPLIGGVAGAVLGVINYEIVSVRWLKLTPAR